MSLYDSVSGSDIHGETSQTVSGGKITITVSGVAGKCHYFDHITCKSDNPAGTYTVKDGSTTIWPVDAGNDLVIETFPTPLKVTSGEDLVVELVVTTAGKLNFTYFSLPDTLG